MIFKKFISNFQNSVLRCFSVVFLLQLLTSHIYSQITPQEAIKQMTKGINLGNTHEPPTEAGWNNPRAQEYYFDLYKEAGFNFVRIPVRWDNYTSTTFPYTVSKAWLDRIEEVAGWGLQRGLFIIINAHHDEWIMKNYSSQVNRDRFDSIWSQIATRFRNKSDRLIFEILNEPNGPITKAQNDDMHKRVLSIIRKKNPTRLVVFQGNNWGGSTELLAAAIPDDQYVIGSFHSYDPYLFGLQGEGTWGSANDYSNLRNKFVSVKAWSDKNNIPVILGEFGSLSSCDYNSRMKHYRAYVDYSREFGIAPAAWDDGGNFRIMLRNEKRWEEIKDILIHSNERSPSNPVVQILQDSIIRVTWANRVPGADSIVVQRRTSSSSFQKVAVFRNDTSLYYDVKPQMNQYYHYRIISFYKDGLIAYTPPQRVFFPAWSKPVRIPFLGYPHPIPGIIEAEDYDKGGQGFTYFETVENNIAGAYRPNEGVDIYDRNGTGFHIGNAVQGEWYEYSVKVKTTGTYEAGFHLASLMGGGKFQVKIGDVLSDTLKAPRTNSWLNTQKVSTTMKLKDGEQIFRFTVISEPLFNIDRFSFDLITQAGPGINQQPDIHVYYSKNAASVYLTSTINEEMQMDLLGINGSLIRSLKASGSELILPVQDVPAGIYIVRIRTESSGVSKKIVLY